MRIRTFVGLNFSIAVTRRIAEEVARRKVEIEQGGHSVLWVPAANLHLTLYFAGSVEEELIEGMAGRLRKITSRRPPFELVVRGLGAFPSLERPRILWVGVAGEGLGTLAESVQAEMAGLGLPKEERPFHAHVTVGRVKDHAPSTGRLPWAGEAELGRSLVSELVIYESRTLQKGAEYVARARIPLAQNS